MNSRLWKKRILLTTAASCMITAAHAGAPLWTFVPLTATTTTVPTNGFATVQYLLTNQSKKPHTLTVSPMPAGITQNTTAGNCSNPVTLGYLQHCTLTLDITGSVLLGNVIGGPKVCGQGSLLQCYQPSQADSLNITLTTAPGQALLSTSVPSTKTLALSVKKTGLNAALTGTPRTITITNTGSVAASGLSVNYPTWPTGTAATSDCGSALSVGGFCTITITPGATTTSSCDTTGTSPTADVITVSASNATPIQSNVVVLSYGCIYQGGYVYAIQDTTPNTGSTGGRVVAQTDEAPRYPLGVIWTSNGAGSVSANVSYDIIPGIAENSTTSLSAPTYATAQTQYNATYLNTNTFPFPSSSLFAACNGRTDGICNSNNIIVLYEAVKTNYGVGSSPYTLALGPTTKSFYAAGLCRAFSGGSNTDWYLPAICEMGPDSGGSGCANGTQNMVINLPSLLGMAPNPGVLTVACLWGNSGLSSTNCLAGHYWSSTEDSTDPQNSAWNQYFESGGGSLQINGNGKYLRLGARCSRALTV